jgi:hypothetical protein
MERKNKRKKSSFSAIVLAVLSILLCAVPCSADHVVIDGENSPYALTTEVDDFIEVAGSNSSIWPEGPGTLQLMAGGYASYGVYINVGGTINIYGSHTWAQSDTYVYVAGTANVTLFTDGTDLILLNTVYGPDAALAGTTITVDTTNGWMGVLTWIYDGIPYSLNISTLSDITVEVVGSSDTIEVEIDIKPGSDSNPINPKSKGLIRVAILTTDEFDAAGVDPGTVKLAGASIAVRGKAGKLMAHLEDIDGDDDFDLVLHVDTQSEGAVWENGEVFLIGRTYEELGAQDIQGSDYIIIVPKDK